MVYLNAKLFCLSVDISAGSCASAEVTTIKRSFERRRDREAGTNTGIAGTGGHHHDRSGGARDPSGNSEHSSRHIKSCSDQSGELTCNPFARIGGFDNSDDIIGPDQRADGLSAANHVEARLYCPAFDAFGEAAASHSGSVFELAPDLGYIDSLPFLIEDAQFAGGRQPGKLEQH